ncbi:ribonuclease Y [Candidatus Roizmanbacteria bacterium RIFCSPLOWO2_02_FULL_43_10]|uniref:Ribonuclease Y n=2 Tax=Candidatus Roizmaniibacteriota TaxID=1752723 RepID=A0A1F7JSF2_9BACT|nr:MAG: ribonuclease Y [Candidatus Roizmanbacteria bacterium RIFCSPHIGHO2_02_FULL_43_11]OGK58552.1 MAG: ribonuclease Y [Candidatus Roizmanbacteria bacterium RIFCSPLOWO2_02_FULL_43_10]
MLQNLLKSLPFFNKQFQEAEKAVEGARLKAKEEVLKAKEEAVNIKAQAEHEVQQLQVELQRKDRDLRAREQEIERAKHQYEEKTKQLEADRTEVATKKDEILEKLERVAKLSQLEAKDLILKGWEEKLKSEIAKRVKAAEEKIKQDSDRIAQEVVIDAMRHGSTDYIAEYTLSTIAIPDDSFKGRIIGKEGRNIRAFELITGVDVDLEEENVIKISSFDAYRREVAKIALEKLLKDGRIQPVRIEEIVKQTKQDLDKIMFEAGQDLVHRVGVYDLPRELVQLLGRFKYRFSYGQNMILHTLEETKIGIALAHELKADVMTVKLGCLFHDIGKVIEDKEGSHIELGVEILKKHGISEAAIHCVAASHEDIPFQSAEAVIVHIADHISGARPGARHEDFEQYLRRIKDIEGIAATKKGVKESYALQAGRELRVVVKPEDISDDEATVLAQKIKEDIEQKFPVFPGQVTITIIRETRAIATSHSRN